MTAATLRPSALTRRRADATRRRVLGGRAGLLFLCALIAANIGNFVFHAVSSRALGTEGYGALNALLVTMLVLSVPVSAVQAALVRTVVEGLERGGVTIRRVLTGAVGAAVVAAAAIATAASPLTRYLHLDSVAPVLLLVPFATGAIVGLVPRSYLLARERFAAAAAAMLAGVAVRVSALVWLLHRGGGLAAALAATALGEVFSTGILLALARDGLLDRGVRARLACREALSAVVAFAGFWLLAASDVVLARHLLDAEAAGDYAAAATVGKAVLFAPQAVTLLLLPRFAARDNRSAHDALRTSARITALLGLGGVGGLLALRRPIVETLFGARFSVPVGVLALVGLGSCALALTNLIVHYDLARSRPKAAPVWLGVLAMVAVTTLSHGSALTIAGAFLAVTVAVLALSVPTRATSASRAERRARSVVPLGPAELDLSVVVPFYNPGPNLIAHVERLVQMLRAEHLQFEVIAVSDGSTDGSAATLATADLAEVQCLCLPSNRGKGAALRAGFTLGRGRYLGFIDADGDLDPAQWHPFLGLMKLYEADVVTGSKRHPLSEVHYPPLRRIYSWTFQQLVRSLFRLRIRDTQTGIKLIRREVLADVLPLMRERRFAFDLEFFVVARRCGWRRFLEAPVRIEQRFGSTISLRSVARMILDTLAIAWRLHVTRAYDCRTRDSADVAPIPLAAEVAA